MRIAAGAKIQVSELQARLPRPPAPVFQAGWGRLPKTDSLQPRLLRLDRHTWTKALGSSGLPLSVSSLGICWWPRPWLVYKRRAPPCSECGRTCGPCHRRRTLISISWQQLWRGAQGSLQALHQPLAPLVGNSAPFQRETCLRGSYFRFTRLQCSWQAGRKVSFQAPQEVPLAPANPSSPGWSSEGPRPRGLIGWALAQLQGCSCLRRCQGVPRKGPERTMMKEGEWGSPSEWGSGGGPGRRRGVALQGAVPWPWGGWAQVTSELWVRRWLASGKGNAGDKAAASGMESWMELAHEGVDWVWRKFQPFWTVCYCCLEAKSCLTLCDPIDCSPPGPLSMGYFKQEMLEWVAISSARASSLPRDWTWVSCISRWILYRWATREALLNSMYACVLSRFGRVQLFVTPWTIARQAPLSMDFSRLEHWSGLPCPLPSLNSLQFLKHHIRSLFLASFPPTQSFTWLNPTFPQGFS